MPKQKEQAKAKAEPLAEPTGRDGPPFIVNGVDPSNDRRLDADERLAWMERQQEAMRKGL